MAHTKEDVFTLAKDFLAELFSRHPGFVDIIRIEYGLNNQIKKTETIIVRVKDDGRHPAARVL